MKLENIHIIKGHIELISGLHIGSGDAGMKIGGVDSQVLKHPQSGLPYIPGSSLKGKMRAMLEWRAGVVAQTGGAPLSYKSWLDLQDEFGKREGLNILKLFGIGGSDKLSDEQALELGPSRLAFWDCNLCQQWLQDNALRMEEKSENRIDRISGTAEDPRFIERVPAGAHFEFTLTQKVIGNDSDQLLSTLLTGLRLLELDGIGGSGSRGYGKIRFINLSLNDQSIQQRLADQPVF